MRRRDLIKTIAAEAARQGLAWELARTGANHDIYRLDGLMIPVGRHRDLDRDYAAMVYRECEAKLGKGWWR